MEHTLNSKLKEVAGSYPGKTLMQIKKHYGYAGYTYKEFYEASLKIAVLLSDIGLQKGDRAAVILENRPEWGIIYFGILNAGCTAVPLDIQSDKDDIEYILDESECKAVFVSYKIISAFDSIPSTVRRIIVSESKENRVKNSLPEGILDYYDLIEDAINIDKTKNFTKQSSGDIASILYTSGTTGRPKGVMLTHNNFYSNYLSANKLGFISRNDKILSILPLHHSFPFMVTLLIPIFSQCEIIYLPTLRGEELQKTMRETGVTVLVVVPQILYMFYRNIISEIKKIPFLPRAVFLFTLEVLWQIRKITGINLSRTLLFKIHRKFGTQFRFFACGGAKLDRDIAVFLLEIGFTIIEGYGLTETSPIVTFNPLKKQKLGSVGKVVPDVKIKICESDPLGVGDVSISGPNVMKGYYKRPEETALVLKDGWFRSGDLGYVDKKGYLYLTGRKNELIVLSSGKNISPEDVETHYSKSPYVKELCAILTGEKEERLMAVVVPDFEYCRKIGEININGMIKWTLENLSKQYPSYKRISGFIITKEDLPRTRLGKLRRFEIRDRYYSALIGTETIRKDECEGITDNDKNIVNSESGKKITEILNKKLDIKKDINASDHLEIDLGLDSLRRVELMAEIDKTFKIYMPDSRMAEIFTIRELIETVDELTTGVKKPERSRLSGKTGETLWNNILKNSPNRKIIKKIDLFPKRSMRFITTLGWCLFFIIFKIVWMIKIKGTEKVPKTGPFILCSNHCSYLDGFIIRVSAPSWLRNNMYFLAFRAYFEAPMVRNFIKMIKIISVDSSVQLINAMQACAYVLNNKQAVCIFPEGGRSIDGELKTFKKGAGILAVELNVPLVPVYIKGSFESWSRTRRFPKPHKITVVYDKAYSIEELKKEGMKQNPEDDYDAVSLGIRKKISGLKKRYGL